MAGIIPQNILEQIRTASDIVEVIGGSIPLKKAGVNFIALCPFHKEKTPSFHVNPQRQVFHCFGCHKGGDVFTFVREYESLSFMDAVRRLAERARIALVVDDQPGEQKSRHIKEVLLQVHEQIAQRWQSALASDASAQIARDYLDRRQVSAEARQLFRLGYSLDSWEDAVNWSRAKGFDMTVMEQAGLVLKREGSEGHYDRFRGRLMFPICDEQGRVIAFSGRTLNPEEKAGKYVNSPETPIFHKSRVFYGLDKSKRPILNSGHAVICEGQLDLIACYMAGVENIVAPQGTAFTAEHAGLLKRYTNEVILCFDGDAAGQNAAIRVYDSLLATGTAIRVVGIPSPHDPDSYIKAAGAEAFKQLLSHAVGFYDFLLNHLCSIHNPNTDKGRLAILNEMAVSLKKADNSVLTDTYARKTALKLGVAPDSVLSEFRKGSRIKSPVAATQAQPLDSPTEQTIRRPSALEMRLLHLFFAGEDMVAWFSTRLDLNWLQNESARRIAALRFAAHFSQTWQGMGAFLTEIAEDSLRDLITEAQFNDPPVVDPERESRDVVTSIRNQYIERQQTSLLQRLVQPEITEADRLVILREHSDLGQLKRRPVE